MENNLNILAKLVEAQGLFITGIYLLAQEKFTEILQAQPNNFEALLYRGYTNLRLNYLDEAVKDADAAIKSDCNRYEPLLLKAMTLFYLCKFQDASQEIEKAKNLLGPREHSDFETQQIKLWEHKIVLEKGKQKIVRSKPEESKNEQQEDIGVSTQIEKSIYTWSQTDNYIYIEIKVELQTQEDLKINLDPRKIEIFFPIGKSRLKLDLFDEIIPEESSHSVYLDHIEIKLKKKTSEMKWIYLESADSQNKLVYERSKANVNYEKVIKERGEYVEDDSLTSFMKSVYSKGDDDTKKAMIRSMSESGGKVLSTNWNEVKGKDFKAQDMEGQESTL